MARDKICTPFLALASPEDKFTVSTIEDLQSRKYLKIGDVVELNGYYTAGDGAGHKRKIEATDDGSGVQLANGLWANIVHNGEVNVSWFGAKGNGVTDDTTSIQKAIDFNSVILLDKSLLLISKRLEVRYSNKTLKSNNITTIKNIGIVDSIILVGNTEESVMKNTIAGVVLRNLVIENSEGYGMTVNNALFGNITNCKFQKCKEDGVYFGFSWGWTISNSRFWLNMKNGLNHKNNSVHAFLIHHSHFIGNYGVGLISPSKSNLDGCIFEKNIENDLLLKEVTSVTVDGCYFEGGRVQLTPTILITNSRFSTVSNSTIGGQNIGILLENSDNIKLSCLDQGLRTYPSTVFNGYVNIRILESNKNILLENVKHPIQLKNELEGSINRMPNGCYKIQNLIENLQLGEDNMFVGWTNFLTKPTIVNVGKITNLQRDSFRLEFQDSTHSYITKTISSLNPKKIYSFMCYITFEKQEDAPQFRVLDTLKERNLDADNMGYYFSPKKGLTGEFVWINRITPNEDGTAKLTLGTPDLSGANKNFTINYIGLFEGDYSLNNFPDFKNIIDKVSQ